MTLEESGYIHVSGGLISEHFVSLMRGDLSGLDVTAPTTFIIPWKPDEPAPDAEKFNSQISLKWEELKNRWDTYGLKLGRMPSEDARNLWIRPLLEALGFEPVYTPKQIEIGSDLKFRFSHRGWHPSPGSNIPPVVHIIDPLQALDVRPERGIPCAHDALQSYLNISDEQWGIVTNGKFLRLLRDFHHTSMKGYVEFDLEAIFLNRGYADFRALYRFAHASRFIPMPSREPGQKGELYLEAYFRHSQKVGETIGGKLRDNVVHAIEALGNGFLNPELLIILKGNETATHQYYEEILKIIYRIIFLLYTEQRGILGGSDVPGHDIYLEDYSITMLREIALTHEDQRDDRHTDLWDGLQVTFAMVKKGAPALGIYAFNGMLFDTSGDLYVSKNRCRNTDLIKAILYLTFTEKPRQRISYVDLSVEEIGAIYESLLDYTPRVIGQPDVIEGRSYAANSFILDPRGSARKSTGSYYTNPALIQELIKSALEPVIEDRLSKAGSDPVAREKALLSIRVCDPACGSGAFLIAASNRLGLELAKIRKPEELPVIEDVQEARRDVLQHCIYGVDINPMAVELAKVSLWINALVKDKPLNFLDHHIKCGNSLIGTTPELMAKGIPSEAFNAIEGDDNKVATAIRKINNEQHKSQTLTKWGVREEMARLCPEKFAKLTDDAEASPTAVEQKKTQYEQLVKSHQYQDEKFLADLLTSAFFWELKDKRAEVPTQGVFIAAASQGVGAISATMKAKIQSLADEFRFFHWHLEFPDVFGGEEAGFDCVIGNPPWEKVKLIEKKWFLGKDDEIANSTSKNQRAEMFKRLEKTNPKLYMKWILSLNGAARESGFLSHSGRFPISAIGDLNTYPLFTELFGRQLLKKTGRAGIVVKTGIATDFTTKDLFSWFVETNTLVSLYDFVNSEGIFPDVAPPERFCLLTISGKDRQYTNFEFSFFNTNFDMMKDTSRRYTLTKDQILKINPNTKNCPVFRSARDRDITLQIYEKYPVLFNEKNKKNYWSINYHTIFHSSNDSYLFNENILENLIRKGYTLNETGIFINANQNDIFLPVFESKNFQQYDHRFGSFENISAERRFIKKAATHRVTSTQKENINYEITTRYWVNKRDFDERLIQIGWNKGWLFSFRKVTNITTNFRTAIATFLKTTPEIDSASILTFHNHINVEKQALLFISFFNSTTFDFTLRQMIGGANFNKFILLQLPMPIPEQIGKMIISYGDKSQKLPDFLIHRSLRLTWSSHALDSLGEAIAPRQGPFIWNDEERRVLRAEIDATIAHVYGITNEEYAYILDSFTILRDKDTEEFSEYRTKRECLEMYKKINIHLEE